jgi:hypothetical protein
MGKGLFGDLGLELFLCLFELVLDGAFGLFLQLVSRGLGLFDDAALGLLALTDVVGDNAFGLLVEQGQFFVVLGELPFSLPFFRFQLLELFSNPVDSGVERLCDRLFQQQNQGHGQNAEVHQPIGVRRNPPLGSFFTVAASRTKSRPCKEQDQGRRGSEDQKTLTHRI